MFHRVTTITSPVFDQTCRDYSVTSPGCNPIVTPTLLGSPSALPATYSAGDNVGGGFLQLLLYSVNELPGNYKNLPSLHKISLCEVSKGHPKRPYIGSTLRPIRSNTCHVNDMTTRGSKFRTTSTFPLFVSLSSNSHLTYTQGSAPPHSP